MENNFFELMKVDIELLQEAEYNPRIEMTEDSPLFAKLKNSIVEFGYIQPIIINSDYTVIGGHQRLKVLKHLKYKEVDCIMLELSKPKEKLLNISLNRVHGEWDFALLKDLLLDLDNTEDGLKLTGFDPEELDKLIDEFDFEVQKEIKNFSEEINVESFEKEQFDYECPCCHFRFNKKKRKS